MTHGGECIFADSFAVDEGVLNVFSVGSDVELIGGVGESRTTSESSAADDGFVPLRRSDRSREFLKKSDASRRKVFLSDFEFRYVGFALVDLFSSVRLLECLS